MATPLSGHRAVGTAHIALAIVVPLTFLSTNLDAAAAKRNYACATVERLRALDSDLKGEAGWRCGVIRFGLAHMPGSIRACSVGCGR